MVFWVILSMVHGLWLPPCWHPMPMKQNQDPLYGALNLLKESKYAFITNTTTLIIKQDQWTTSIACWHAKFVIIWANVAKITSIHHGWCLKTSKKKKLKEKNICNVQTTNEWNHVRFCLIHSHIHQLII